MYRKLACFLLFVALAGCQQKKSPPHPLIDAAVNPPGKVSLFVFTMPNCLPCKADAPLVDALAFRFNHVERLGLNHALAKDLGINSAPTYVLVQGVTVLLVTGDLMEVVRWLDRGLPC